MSSALHKLTVDTVATRVIDLVLCANMALRWHGAICGDSLGHGRWWSTVSWSSLRRWPIEQIEASNNSEMQHAFHLFTAVLFESVELGSIRDPDLRNDRTETIFVFFSAEAVLLNLS